jgi:hypothetical protein
MSGLCDIEPEQSTGSGSFTIGIVRPAGAGRTEESHCLGVSFAAIAVDSPLTTKRLWPNTTPTFGARTTSGDQRHRVTAAQLS